MNESDFRLPLSVGSMDGFPEVTGFRSLRELDGTISFRLQSGTSTSFYPIHVTEPSFQNCLVQVFNYPDKHRIQYYTVDPLQYGFVIATRYPISPASGVAVGLNEVIIDRYQFRLTSNNEIFMLLGVADKWYMVDPTYWAYLEMTIWAMNEPTKFALVVTPTPDDKVRTARLEWLKKQ